MKQKNTFMRSLTPLMEERYGWARTEMILDHIQTDYQKLCADNSGESSAVKAHTVEKIYPTIAAYRSLQKAGIPQAEALQFLDQTHSQLAERKAASMRAMCRLPFVRKLMPSIFKWVTLNTFGEKAGFQATFYPTEKTRCKFDMTKCLYCDVCRRNGCPELTVCFCHTDDVTDGNMHPRLLWNRTRTMGEGGDCCDFDLILLKDGETPETYQQPSGPEASE